MFNARKSALYLAMVGLAFAAGEASAVCTPSARVNGILVCMNGKPGSLICDTEAQVDPQCGLTESCGFGSSPFTSQTQLTSACSYTGAAVNGVIYPPIVTFNRFNTLRAIQARNVSVGDDDEDDFGDDGNKHKKIKCKNGVIKGTKPPVPCTKYRTDGSTDALFDGSGNSVSELPPDSVPPVPMTCKNNGVCKATEEILPTGLFCANGGPAIDFTPLRASSFIVAVTIEEGTDGPSATAHFGCLGSQGNQYSCEAIDNFSSAPCDGGEGGFGHDTGKLYCQTGDLPEGRLICGSPIL